MLHAFNYKNARRVLASSRAEHTNDKNEDAITSMVFTPLTFMPPAAALEILSSFVGAAVRRIASNRCVVSHEVSLWPSSLQARQWAGTAATRCEPDLVVRFAFTEGPPLVIVGEMKWDWRIKAGHLTEETDRQRRALADADPEAEQVVFTVTKFRLSSEIKNAVQLTWSQVHDIANRLARTAESLPARRWAILVGDFLEKAEQVSFQGFQMSDLPQTKPKPIAFWSVN